MDHGERSGVEWDRVLIELGMSLEGPRILEMDFADRPDKATKRLSKFLEVAGDDHPRIKDAKERLELLEALKQAG